MRKKAEILSLILVLLISQNSLALSESKLQKEQWIHGSVDCKTNADPAVDIYVHREDTYILRQNKCDTFEAPFLYVLIGEKQVLLLDTGALENAAGNSDQNLYQQVQSLAGVSGKPLLVLHSHSHSDHVAGDPQFQHQNGVQMVKAKTTAMRDFFGFDQWTEGESLLDLGERELRVFPIPGHQEESIAIYDSDTGWLMTGDTVYPGYIYVKHWQSYKDSIARLVAFTEAHPVSAIMGSHIEMKKSPGEFYPIGTLYQPDEAFLDLPVSSLLKLNRSLQAQEKPGLIKQERLIVAPMGTVRKTLSNLVRWLRDQ